MHIIIGLALGLILVGLLMCWLKGSIHQPTLASVVYWTGIVLVVVGLILLLTPVLLWINLQLRSAMGV